MCPAPIPLCSVGSDIGASNVPGHSEYLTFYNDFAQIWVQATGAARVCVGGASNASFGMFGRVEGVHALAQDASASEGHHCFGAPC